MPQILDIYGHLQGFKTFTPDDWSETMLISLLTIYICCVAPAVRAN